MIKHLKEVSNVKIIKLENVFSDDDKLKIQQNSKDYNDDHLNEILSVINEDKLFLDDDIPNFFKSFFTKRKYNDNFCPVGMKNITIDVCGNIWRCKLFFNKNNYFMGNITDGLDNVNFNFNRVSAILTKLRKSDDLECKECISKCFCTRCVGMCALLKNKQINDFNDFGVSCDYRKSGNYKILDVLSKYVAENKFEDFNMNFLSVIDM